MTFEEFKKEKYTIPPWDFSDNPMGFPDSDKRELYSDIVAHLPILEYFATKCNHITEFGFRGGNSAIALISGCKGKVISYDLYYSAEVGLFSKMNLPCQWEFRHANTLDLNDSDVEETDLLFIDTLHTYQQVKGELRFANKVRKYIAFHDTWSHGKESRDIAGELGISNAINEFLIEHPEWKKIYEVNFNHGLIILEKVNQ